MDRLDTLLLRVRSLLGMRSLDRELNDELRFHVEMQAAVYEREGLSAHEARRRALLVFGGVERMSEECRDTRPGGGVHALIRALRLAARRLVRERLFVVPAVATLGIGIGALLAIFTLADAVLLKPLPYPDADRIVTLRHALPGFGIADAGQSDGTYVHYREGARVFESVGAYFDRELSITDGEPERVLAALVTPGVLEVLGVRPVLGRVFDADDSSAGRVLLSHGLWQRRYGGDETIIGRQIEVNGAQQEVIGVLPPGVDFPSAATQMLFGAGETTAAGAELRDMYRSAIGRLRPGVTPADAEADLVRLAGTLGERFADATPELLAEAQLMPRVRPLKESVVADIRPALVLLLCTAVFVLLIALANVANLALVRAEHQRREVALERALGASSRAVLLRFATEYTLVALAGGVLGLAVTLAAVRLRFGFEPWQIPRLDQVAVTARTVGVLLAATAVTAAVLTGVGMLRGARVDVQGALKGSLQRMTPSRESRVAQQALSSLQVALACALLVGSAVMVQSVRQLGRVELGFAPSHVVAFDLALPARQYLPYARSAAFVDELRAALLQIPGVQAVDAVSVLPLTPQIWYDLPIAAAGMPHDGPVQPIASVRLVTPGYFRTMGIPLRRGRTFVTADLNDTHSGVIIAESLARRLFGDVDPVGRLVELPASRAGVLTVVGVAGDVRDASLTAPAAPLLYLPALGGAQLSDGHAPIPFYPSEPTFVVRSELPLGALIPPMRSALQRLDPRLPLANPRTLDDIVAASSARTRLTAWLLIAAAGSALLLGMVGIYGVVAYAVSRRTPELALRMALGATGGSVTRMVLGQGAVIAMAGVALGVPIAFALTRLLGGMLFEVSPHDARAFILVPAAMLLVALLASSVPARRAARTNPARAFAPD